MPLLYCARLFRARALRTYTLDQLVHRFKALRSKVLNII